jgi:hypothetical protein
MQLADVFFFVFRPQHSLLLEIGCGDRTGQGRGHQMTVTLRARSALRALSPWPSGHASDSCPAIQSHAIPCYPMLSHPIQSSPVQSSPIQACRPPPSTIASAASSPLFPSGLELSRSSSASPPEAHEPLPATPRWASAPPTPLLVSSIPSFSFAFAFASPFRSLPQVRFSRR